jgi:hypothetical protein
MFGSDHDLFRESVAAFVSRELLPRYEDFTAERRIDRQSWRAAGGVSDESVVV